MDVMVETPAKRTARRLIGRLRQWAARAMRVNKLFAYTVVVPTFLGTVYFWVIAHDIYVSESEFVVRSPQQQPLTGVGSLLQSTGLSPGGEDVYSVQEFITSRNALQKLEERFHLKRSFSDHSIDRLRRFPALDGDDSFEGLLRYYRNRVITTDLDTSSSILTLTVRAFSAEDAFRINKALLEMSEDLVNELNERGRKDLVQFASIEVEKAEEAEKSAVLAVSNYRNSKSVFDPEKQSTLQLAQVGKLQEELLITRQQIADLGSVARNNPQLPLLVNRAKVLESAIATEMAKVAGDRLSLSSKSAGYESFALERDFAAKRLEIALASLAQAREYAMKQQLYLERIAEPNLPDIAIEPRRVRAVITTFLLSLVLWGILSLLLTAVKEHAE